MTSGRLAFKSSKMSGRKFQLKRLGKKPRAPRMMPQTANERAAELAAAKYDQRLTDLRVCVFIAEDLDMTALFLKQLTDTAGCVGVVLKMDGGRCDAIHLANKYDVVSIWLANIVECDGEIFDLAYSTLPADLRDVLESNNIVKVSNHMTDVTSKIHELFGIEMHSAVDTSLLALQARANIAWDVDEKTSEITLTDLTLKLTGMELESPPLQ
ncbi:hypothetical protein SCHPADRAFT_897288 [Schizopora paradoxa]|uniref:3'-5' exonuclease domain-containing protein n=1 Tax=Schizopora paradoxa TaxID=27342 RepID=A0A0H2QXL0_9AGAM|nr:hypothetical protein SCHPADRAFT_897288 [Schizopora paradoxa]